MKTYEVWEEGYICSGMEGIPARAILVGSAEADSFREACLIVVKRERPNDYKKHFNEDRLSYWGCKWFDNKYDAEAWERKWDDR